MVDYKVVVKDGVVYITWPGYSDEMRPASKETMKQHGYPETQKQQEARDAHMDAFLKEYRTAQARRTPEQLAEERFEMRAAFGKGVKVVNVFTGEEIQL